MSTKMNGDEGILMEGVKCGGICIGELIGGYPPKILAFGSPIPSIAAISACAYHKPSRKRPRTKSRGIFEYSIVIFGSSNRDQTCKISDNFKVKNLQKCYELDLDTIFYRDLCFVLQSGCS